MILGYDYAFSKRASFYATAGYVAEKVKNPLEDKKLNKHMVGTGLVHSF